MSARRARPAYDRWRDDQGTHIDEGCLVEQVRVDRVSGALRCRLHQRGEVVRHGRGNRLQVRFAGSPEPVSIRPHLVRVLPAEDAGTRLPGGQP